jgi:hypothetical protein
MVLHSYKGKTKGKSAPAQEKTADPGMWWPGCGLFSLTPEKLL